MEPRGNLVLLGFMGTGKSALGRRVAALTGTTFLEMDAELERRAGKPIAQIFADEGEAGFREREKAVLHDLFAGHGQLVSTGGGAVLDAENRMWMKQRGYVVYLQVSVEAQLKRLGRCTNRPLLQRADREQVLHDMAVTREPLYREVADLTLDTVGLSPPEATARLTQLLAHRWQPIEENA